MWHTCTRPGEDFDQKSYDDFFASEEWQGFTPILGYDHYHAPYVFAMLNHDDYLEPLYLQNYQQGTKGLHQTIIEHVGETFERVDSLYRSVGENPIMILPRDRALLRCVCDNSEYVCVEISPQFNLVIHKDLVENPLFKRLLPYPAIFVIFIGCMDEPRLPFDVWRDSENMIKKMDIKTQRYTHHEKLPEYILKCAMRFRHDWVQLQDNANFAMEIERVCDGDVYYYTYFTLWLWVLGITNMHPPTDLILLF